MKNIRIYHPAKYNGKDYKKVKENIYETAKHSSSSLQQVLDDNLAEKLLKMDNWKKCEDKAEEDLLYTIYDGKKYFIDNEYDEKVVFEKSDDEDQKEYVTSIMFEPEPEFGENKPTDSEISQYPLEFLLDEFLCYCDDDYIKENKNDPVNSYVEFASSEIESIENLLTIVGKHVYNKKDGEYIKLAIE